MMGVIVAKALVSALTSSHAAKTNQDMSTQGTFIASPQKLIYGHKAVIQSLESMVLHDQGALWRLGVTAAQFSRLAILVLQPFVYLTKMERIGFNGGNRWKDHPIQSLG